MKKLNQQVNIYLKLMNMKFIKLKDYIEKYP